MNNTFRKILSYSFAATTLVSSTAFAGGYEWSEPSFHNPATMVFVNKVDVRGYMNSVFTYNNFDGVVTDAFGTKVGPGRATSIPNWMYPSFDAKFRYNEKIVWGLDFNKPYGVDIQYPINSVVAPTGTITKLDADQITPSIAYSVTPKFAIGAGANFIVSRSNLGSVPYFPSRQQFLTKFSNTWGYGVNAGIMYQLFKGTFFDAVFYPQKYLRADGESSLGTTPVSTDVSAKLLLPNKLRLTLTQAFSPTSFVYLSSDFTNWAKVQQIVLENNLGGGQDSTIQLNYRNTWSIYVGGSYAPVPKFIIDGGAGYDPTSVNHRRGSAAPNLPAGTDNINIWFQGSYEFSKPLRINAGYSHFFLQRITSISTPQVGKSYSVGVNRKEANSFWAGLFYVI